MGSLSENRSHNTQIPGQAIQVYRLTSPGTIEFFSIQPRIPAIRLLFLPEFCPRSRFASRNGHSAFGTQQCVTGRLTSTARQGTFLSLDSAAGCQLADDLNCPKLPMFTPLHHPGASLSICAAHNLVFPQFADQLYNLPKHNKSPPAGPWFFRFWLKFIPPASCPSPLSPSRFLHEYP